MCRSTSSISGPSPADRTGADLAPDRVAGPPIGLTEGMASGATAQYHALVEEDLNQERAGALGRAGRRIGAAIADCTAARRRLAEAEVDGDGAARAEAVEDYDDAFARYERARKDFCIQREANRLYDHRLIDHFYPPPDDPRLVTGRR